jgi:hypothetical protein
MVNHIFCPVSANAVAVRARRRGLAATAALPTVGRKGRLRREGTSDYWGEAFVSRAAHSGRTRETHIFFNGSADDTDARHRPRRM